MTTTPPPPPAAAAAATTRPAAPAPPPPRPPPPPPLWRPCPRPPPPKCPPWPPGGGGRGWRGAWRALMRAERDAVRGGRVVVLISDAVLDAGVVVTRGRVTESEGGGGATEGGGGDAPPSPPAVGATILIAARRPAGPPRPGDALTLPWPVPMVAVGGEVCLVPPLALD